MKYNIKKITDLSGEERIDGRYPLRKGRRFDFFEFPKVNERMTLEYFPREGETYSGYLSTSPVQKIVIDDTGIVVTTRNSIYHLVEEE